MLMQQLFSWAFPSSPNSIRRFAAESDLRKHCGGHLTALTSNGVASGGANGGDASPSDAGASANGGDASPNDACASPNGACATGDANAGPSAPLRVLDDRLRLMWSRPERHPGWLAAARLQRADAAPAVLPARSRPMLPRRRQIQRRVSENG